MKLDDYLEKYTIVTSQELFLNKHEHVRMNEQGEKITVIQTSGWFVVVDNMGVIHEFKKGS